MHPRPRIERGAARRQCGFTLIEAVMTIAITGVVIGIVAIFIAPATTAYFESSARARLGDEADTALRRIGRELARALPNSVRVSASGRSLELIPVSSAARYAVESGDTLQFGTADASFATVGPPLRLSRAGQQLAWYNLGAGVPDADAYTLANVRSATNPAGDAGNVGIVNAGLPNALQAPPYRVYAIEPPVSFRCDPVAGTLTRHSGYGFAATQPDPPAGGSAALLARQVSACSFSLETGAATPRHALVTLRLTLQSRGESVSLYQTVHVDNLP